MGYDEDRHSGGTVPQALIQETDEVRQNIFGTFGVMGYVGQPAQRQAAQGLGAAEMTTRSLFMNTKATFKGLTTGVLALGAIAALAGFTAPAQAQGYGGNGHMFRGGRPMPNAAWSEIDKTPRFGTNSRPGYYVWRQGNEVFVVNNSPNRQFARRFAGEVTVQGGSLSHVDGYQTERNDQFYQQNGNHAHFAFQTSNGLDGIKFHVDGGKRIVVRLEGFDQDHDRFFLGQDKIGTTVNPLVIEK
jgi:hypothetical protein